MADSKISALPASTVPLAGTEVLPIVQAGATKQVSVANLTAGRAVSVLSLTPASTNGIIGTTTNDNANTGSVGEYVSATLAAGSAVTLTTGTITNVTSISLTAGDWDISGTVGLVMTGTTSLNYFSLGTTTSAGGGPNLDAGFQLGFPTGGGAIAVSGVGPVYPIPTARYSLSATTTIYLNANVSFSTSTCKAYGVIRARRIR